MAELIECDGCGRTDRKGGNIKLVELRPSPGLGQPAAIWKRDLCPSCIKQIRDPATWPRAEEATS